MGCMNDLDLSSAGLLILPQARQNASIWLSKFWQGLYKCNIHNVKSTSFLLGA